MKAKKLFSLILPVVLCFMIGFAVNPNKVFAEDTNTNVAKVGNVEYATIDEAIANWTNGTTLTLLADVTLSDVIQLSSTEYHVLDLGTYTMTAASKKDAIQIVNNGRSSASYALDIKADDTNPGGITASGKAIVRTTGKSDVKDRPIIRFYSGVFNASYIVYHSGSNGTNCPQFQFHGGDYTGTIYTNRTLNQFYGGTFHGNLMMSVDSSAYTLISGGTFKQLTNLYMSGLNSSKFTIGSSKGVYDREVYVDDNGYYVVTKTANTDNYEALVSKTPGTNDYFKYSKVGVSGGMNYTDAQIAVDNNNGSTITFLQECEINVAKSITIDLTAENAVAPTVNLTSKTAKVTVEGDASSITVNSVVEGYELVSVEVDNGDGTTTNTYSVHKFSDAWTFDKDYHWHKCECEDCNTAVKDKTEHIKTRVDAQEPTCEEDGWKTYYVCTICDVILDENGEILSEIPVIPAAHKFSTDWTFDEEGHWNACENCDERSNYAEHNNGEWILDETGHWHECEDCGAVNDFAAHSNEWVSTEEMHLEKCTVCNYKTEFVAHNNGEWISDETGHWHECEDCGTINDFAGHSGGENTCKSGAICEHCGMEYGEIDPDNHVGQTIVKNKMDTWFFADGYTGDTYCAGCDELFELGRTVPKTEYSSWNWWVWVIFILLLPIMIFFII